ncbi:MAG: Crp/Fnr family transcriptional regulator [Actinomycetota bacterium]|nr:Crp/Fnr family transcriptional regulator [Actinomycetota bacterium]
MTEAMAAALATHPFLHGMSRDQLAILAESGSEVTFPARHRLIEDGGHASRFWLIRSGCVALDLNVPGQGLVRIETIGLGELLGWSWLFPPFTWAFGAVTVSPVEAFEFDGRAARASCAADPAFGYELTRRFTLVIANRLQATRIRLISASARSTSFPG